MYVRDALFSSLVQIVFTEMNQVNRDMWVVSVQEPVWMPSTEQAEPRCISHAPNSIFCRKEIHAAWKP